jgi:hypothetical protein
VKGALIIAAALAVAGPVLAQEDWDVTANPETNLTLVSLDFGSNVLAFRCQNKVFDFILTGTPPAEAERRTVTVSAGRISAERQAWLSQPGMQHLSAAEPARLARELRAGGVLDIRIEPTNEADRARRYQFPTPASPAAIDQALQACDQPLADDRDGIARLSTDFSWAHRPTPLYPDNDRALAARAGRVMLNCIIGANMHATLCRVESEEPSRMGFAESAIRSAMEAEIDPKGDPESVRGRVIRFPITFRLP